MVMGPLPTKWKNAPDQDVSEVLTKSVKINSNILSLDLHGSGLNSRLKLNLTSIS
jgi:hypothetical protein